MSPADIEAYQVEMKPYFDGLIALRDKLKSELDGIEQAIDTTKIETTEEVKKYLPEEEAISK